MLCQSKVGLPLYLRQDKQPIMCHFIVHVIHYHKCYSSCFLSEILMFHIFVLSLLDYTVQMGLVLFWYQKHMAYSD